MSSEKFPPRRREKLLFERSLPGKLGAEPPGWDGPDAAPLPERHTRKEIQGFPELSEREVARHYTRLSQLNYGNDVGLYPLGSCTMKYNPKVNEKVARLEGFAEAHPLLPEAAAAGCLQVMADLERYLCEITGMHACTLQPAAGAQGEFTGIRIVRAHHDRLNDPRSVVLIPDSAHGTNPASAHLCGYRVEEIPSNSRGCIDLAALRERMAPDVAVLMLTNPNTLGVFESEIEEITRVVHAAGGLVYLDGANLNAYIGVARPGDMGIDVMHTNLHKTFSTPHGGGGPGSGPVGVIEALAPYLPVPRTVRTEAGWRLSEDFPDSIGKIHAFHGNFGMMVRACAYILANGAAGLREVAEAEASPELLQQAPHTTPIGRLDEATAARKPILRWRPSPAPEVD